MLSQTEIADRLETTAQAIKKRPAAFPDILLTSSRTGAGMGDLRAAIARLMQERGEALPPVKPV